MIFNNTVVSVSDCRILRLGKYQLESFSSQQIYFAFIFWDENITLKYQDESVRPLASVVKEKWLVSYCKYEFHCSQSIEEISEKDTYFKYFSFLR